MVKEVVGKFPVTLAGPGVKAGAGVTADAARA